MVVAGGLTPRYGLLSVVLLGCFWLAGIACALGFWDFLCFQQYQTPLTIVFLYACFSNVPPILPLGAFFILFFFFPRLLARAPCFAQTSSFTSFSATSYSLHSTFTSGRCPQCINIAAVSSTMISCLPSPPVLVFSHLPPLVSFHVH